MATGKPHRLAAHRLADIAVQLGGKLTGDGSVQISGVASLESAGAGDISFVTQVRYKPALQRCKASAVIVPEALANATGLPHVVCKDPYLAYARVARLFNPDVAPVAGVHASAIVEAGAQIAADASVGAGAFIGAGAIIGARSAIGPGTQVGAHCSIGADCVLHARVTLYAGCIVGDRCIIHSGAVIGADGFGFAPEREKGGAWLKIRRPVAW